MVRELNIEIIQGAIYDEVFVWVDANDKPINLDGYEAKMQIRTGKNRHSSLLHTVDDFNIHPDEGSVQPIMTSNETRELDFSWAYYDLILIPPEGSTKQVRLVQGRVFLNTEVTYVPTVKNSPTLYNSLSLTLGGNSNITSTTSSQPGEIVNENTAESLPQVILLRGQSRVITNDGFIASDWDDPNFANTATSITIAWLAQAEAEYWEVRLNGGSLVQVNGESHTFTNLPKGEYLAERRGYGTGGYSNWTEILVQTNETEDNISSSATSSITEITAQ